MATKCPKCHTENPETSLFCSDCGTKLDAAGEFSLFQTETLETSLKELRMGATFADRYQIIEELGKGGMGKVYKVLDTHINEKVALKLLKPEIGADRKTIERFSNELKFARRIRHKNVCGMYDLGKAEGTNFITMEYVQGEDLKSMIRMAAGLSIGAVLSIGKQICDGLVEAHALGVVHRDLKPQNIMIDKGGNAKIMDFGIARLIREKGITGPSVLIGTPEYMSPEQAEAKEVDYRSDIYSLGIILYEMATGRVPFEGDTPLSIAMKHKGEIPKNPKQFNPNIPDDLSGVILKCMEKDRAKRYQTAPEVHSELEKIEKGIPTTERVVPERRTLTSREITVKFNLKKLLMPTGIVLLGVCAALVFFFRSRGPHYNPKRIIVPVFENQTGDKSLDTIGRIAADWITQGLSRTGLVEVVSLPPSVAAPGTPQAADQVRSIARDEGAGTLIAGSYFLKGQSLSFHSQISIPKNGHLIKALEPVEGSINEPTIAIDVLRQKIMGVLAFVNEPGMRATFEMFGQPPTYEAYKELIEGQQSFFQYDFQKAIQHYSRAAEIDPSQKASSLSWIATAYLNIGDFGKADEFAKEAEKFQDKLSPFEKSGLEWLNAQLQGDLGTQLRIARQLAKYFGGSRNNQWAQECIESNRPREAIRAFKKQNPENLWAKMTYEWWDDNITRAYHMLGKHQDELKQARGFRKKYPDDIRVLAHEARALAAMGNIEEINKLVDQSLALKQDPTYSSGTVILDTGRELKTHGFRIESMQLLERGIRWLNERPRGEAETTRHRFDLAQSLYYGERWEEANELFEELVKEVPANIDYLGYLGLTAARSGTRDGALKISDQIAELNVPFPQGWHTCYRACIAAVQGEKESAIGLLREAIGQGVDYWWLYWEPDFESLRDYPPFKELIKPKG